MLEESSFNEVERIREELARERAWEDRTEAQAILELATRCYELAHAAEMWGNRATEGFIATNTSPVASSTVEYLLAQLDAIRSVVNADLN